MATRILTVSSTSQLTAGWEVVMCWLRHRNPGLLVPHCNCHCRTSTRWQNRKSGQNSHNIGKTWIEMEYTVFQYNNAMRIPYIQQLSYKYCGKFVTAAVLNESARHYLHWQSNKAGSKHWSWKATRNSLFRSLNNTSMKLWIQFPRTVFFDLPMWLIQRRFCWSHWTTSNSIL